MRFTSWLGRLFDRLWATALVVVVVIALHEKFLVPVYEAKLQERQATFMERMRELQLRAYEVEQKLDLERMRLDAEYPDHEGLQRLR